MESFLESKRPGSAYARAPLRVLSEENAAQTGSSDPVTGWAVGWLALTSSMNTRSTPRACGTELWPHRKGASFLSWPPLYSVCVMLGKGLAFSQEHLWFLKMCSLGAKRAVAIPQSSSPERPRPGPHAPPPCAAPSSL